MALPADKLRPMTGWITTITASGAYRFAARVGAVFTDAFRRMNSNDGFALASHVALSTLLALFPFIIFVTAVASFLDLRDTADAVIDLIFETWPPSIAEPISREINSVLTVPRGDLLTLGIMLAIWLASNGIEALRTGLNRAYGVHDTRNYVWCRIKSIGFVLIGAFALLAFGVLLVAGPIGWHYLIARAPQLESLSRLVTVVRYGVATIILLIALLVAHRWLPGGRRTFREILPGIAFTLAVWILGGSLFATYLASFSNIATTYAGMATVMTALIFLYLVSAVLLFGGSLNAAIRDEADRRRARRMLEEAGPERSPPAAERPVRP